VGINLKVLFLEYVKPYLRGFPYGFQELGCDVEILEDFDYRLLEATIKRFKPDVIMTAGWTQIHVPIKMKALAKLKKKYKIIHIYWATEDPLWFERWSFPLIRISKPDIVFTISRETVPLYHKLGKRAYYLPWACNPVFHRKTTPQREYECDIAVVATAPIKGTDFRVASIMTLLAPLLNKNYTIKIWGNGWKNNEVLAAAGIQVDEKYLHGELDFDKTNDVYSSAKIILGFQNNDLELTQRTYEVLAAEGFLLAPASQAISERFIHKKHLITSSSPEETLELVDYYLKNEEERKQIARNGQQEVVENHTYKMRAALILEAVQELLSEKGRR
jgi:spore maturation protein CgeB